MEQEILAAKGRLSIYRRDLNELDVQAKGNIRLIRTLLSPYEEDVTALRTDEAEASAIRLAEIVREMRVLKDKINRLAADLGREA